MSAMWYPLLGVALLCAVVPLSTVNGEPSPPAAPAFTSVPAPPENILDTPEHVQPKLISTNSRGSKLLEPSSILESKMLEPFSAREPKLLESSFSRQPKLLERDRANFRNAQRTLDRGASELAWRNWLQSPESKDPAAPPRRITPKSVFIAPVNCPEGKRLSGEGCITVQQLGKEAHEMYILEQLNNMNDAGASNYDYDDGPSGPAIDAAEGPLQLNLPLGGLIAAASENMPSRLPHNGKKEENNKNEATAQLEAELEKLKHEVQRHSHTAKNELQKPQNHTVIGEYDKLTADKLKRDNVKANDTVQEPYQDEGQKEFIFGNVSEDPYLTNNKTGDNVNDIQTDNETLSPTNQKIEFYEIHNSSELVDETAAQTSTTLQSSDPATQKFVEMTTTLVPNNLKDNEKPTKLHPEIDYSDIGEAIKLISRFAEVTTDDTFKNEHNKKNMEEEGPLGTRTKQQHRRKPLQGDAEVIQDNAGLYPPPPPPSSIYADRVAAHLVYPKTTSLGLNQRLDYFHYPDQAPNYPQPPADYPFQHVQEYWTHPEQFLGPYAHGNPRRHHHSFSQPPHRAHRPDIAAPAYSATRDFYRLLGLRHWFSGDDAAKR